jgi:hypothetical protein
MASPPAPPQGKAPILECVREGFSFLARDWRLILPVSLVGAAALTPLEVWGDAGARMPATLLGALVQVPVLAAFYRRALSRGAEPLELRAGRDELNLAAVSAALAFLFVIVFVIGMILIATALAVLGIGSESELESLQRLPTEEAAKRFGELLGSDGQLVLMVSVAALAGFAIWLSARLALAYAATVDAGRMQVFSTWTWTKGNAAPVAACLLLTLLLGLMLAMVAAIVPDMLATTIFGSAQSGVAHWLTTFVHALASIMFFLAPYAAMTAYLYRGLKPPGS